MPKTQYTKTALKEAIAGKLQRHFACEVEDATKDQVYEACALVVRDALTEHMIETQNEVEQDGERQVHYLCMEFLVGRSLRNNAYNLGMLDALTAALKDMGFEMADIFEEEADPGLGNGGLGRLAACYMDGMATDGVLHPLRARHFQAEDRRRPAGRAAGFLAVYRRGLADSGNG